MSWSTEKFFQRDLDRDVLYLHHRRLTTVRSIINNAREQERERGDTKDKQKSKKRCVVHLGLPKIIVDHGEVKAEVFHITFIALEEKQVSVHLWV